ncbi:MAG: type II secretion system minor pseudopilin GspK [Pseudomonadota bacterium]
MTSSVRQQRGAALLTVLLLVATLSVLMIGMTEVLSRSTRQAALAATRDQAFWILYGVEGAALDFLEQRASTPGVPVTALFAQPITIPTEFGVATIAFRDGTNCFNVNSLVLADDNGQRFNADAAEQFSFLANALGTDRTTGRVLAARIADFIDTNNNAESASFEDYDYQRRTVPYRAPGRALRSISELRAIEGFTQEVFLALAPHLCAAGLGGEQTLNVNTLGAADYPLIAAMTRDGVPPRVFETVLRNRRQRGFENVEEFLKRAGLENVGGVEDSDVAAVFGDQSTRLHMTITVVAPMGRLSMTSTLDRQNGTLSVVERRLGQAL